MYLILFYIVEPELAADKTRVMHLFVAQDELPAGRYAPLEHYCPAPDCDCRRVMFTLVREDCPRRSLVSINYAFDRDDPMAGPFVDRINAQSKHGEALLKLVREVVLTDPRYLARLERYYALVKRAALDPDRAAHDALQELIRNGGGHVRHRSMASVDGLGGPQRPVPPRQRKKAQALLHAEGSVTGARSPGLQVSDVCSRG